jgi:hypothetical protein
VPRCVDFGQTPQRRFDLFRLVDRQKRSSSIKFQGYYSLLKKDRMLVCCPSSNLVCCTILKSYNICVIYKNNI